MSVSKKVLEIRRPPSPHWVGDGFPVSSVIKPRGGRALGPFVLMDYAGPEQFSPSDSRRGVDTHPHKGFETVTIVFEGEVEHRDSAGNSGKVGPGDVQWMTAGSGVLHEEKHSQQFTERGGVLEMAQIWVNLPAKDKASAPGYQTIEARDIPVVPLPGGAGHVSLVAGDYLQTPGAAQTFTPVTVWLVSVDSASQFDLPIPDGQEGGVYVRRGSVSVGGEEASQTEFVEFGIEGAGLTFKSDGPTELLVLAGTPIDEPMVAHGPFVMNTQAEIVEAFREFQSGKYGSIASA